MDRVIIKNFCAESLKRNDSKQNWREASRLVPTDWVVTEPRRADSIHRAESCHLQIDFYFLHRYTYTLLVVFNLHFPFIYDYFYLVLILIWIEKMLQFSKGVIPFHFPIHYFTSHTPFHITPTQLFTKPYTPTSYTPTSYTSLTPIYISSFDHPITHKTHMHFTT